MASATRYTPPKSGAKTIAKLLAMPHVREAWQDSDGYWISYHDGYLSPRTECQRDREDCARDALKAARLCARYGSPRCGMVQRGN